MFSRGAGPTGDWLGESTHMRAETYNTRGSAFAAKGDYRKAIADFDAAIRTEAGNTAAKHNRALAYEKLNEAKVR
jgi:Tfp pilus assembly protein PilF